MARILYASQVDELKGSIGGLTFHRNQSGTICKLKPSFRYSASEAQSTRKNLFGTSVLNWGTEPLANKQAWNAFAAANTWTDYWGGVKTISGYNMYIACNLNRIQCGLAAINTPGSAYGTMAVPAFTLSKSSTTLNVAFSPAFNTNPVPGSVTFYCIVFATPPLRSTSLLQKKSLQFLRVVAPGSITSITLRSQYESKFGVTWANIYDKQGMRVVVQIATIATYTGLSSAFTGKVV